MIRALLSVSFLVLKARASMRQIRESYEARRRNNTDAVLTRALPMQNGFYDGHLHEYGCWCYYGGDSRSMHYGHGEPMDAWDGACKQLQEGYACAFLDSTAAGGAVCEPWSVDYDANIDDFGLFAAQMEYTPEQARTHIDTKCREVLTDDCAITACLVEGMYMYEVEVLIFDTFFGSHILAIQRITTEANYISNGFNREENCGAPTASEGPKSPQEKECCGEQPWRFPFNTRDGAKECCEGESGHGHVFNVAGKTCCADGSVVSTLLGC